MFNYEVKDDQELLCLKEEKSRRACHAEAWRRRVPLEAGCNRVGTEADCRLKKEDRQKRDEGCHEEVKPLLDKALMLHLALPEKGYASQRALQRIALYQAKSRAFGMVTFLENIRAVVGCGAIGTNTVPGSYVRDIGLPVFSRSAKNHKSAAVVKAIL